MTCRDKKVFSESAGKWGVECSSACNREVYIRCMRPFKIISHIHGACPLIYKNEVFVASPTLSILGFTIAVMASITRIILLPHYHGGSFFKTVLLITDILLPMACILSFVVLGIHIKKSVKCANDSLKFCHFLTSNKMKNMYFFQIFLIVLGYVCFGGTTVMYYIVRPDLFQGVSLYHRLLEMYLNTTMWIFKLQFFWCIYFLRNILICIRQKISTLPTVETSPRILYESVALELNQLFTSFEEVIKIGELINESYGVAMGVASLLTAVNCIATAYFLLILQEEGGGTGLLLTTWLLSDFAQQWLVLTSTELFLKEVSQMAMTVCETLRALRVELLISKLQQFSMYLLHRRVKFTICGLVPLDYTLLFTIGGAVTSYMVVLIQFQKSEESKIPCNITYSTNGGS